MCQPAGLWWEAWCRWDSEYSPGSKPLARRIRLHNLGLAFSAVTYGNQENSALAFGMRREELDYVIVVKGEAAGAEALCIGCQIKFAAENAGLKLYSAIRAVSEAIKNLS